MSRPPIPEPYATRIANVRADMKSRKLDAYLVENRMDQYWLTGFTGEDGAVLLTQRQVILLTDGRFDEAAEREAPFARKVLRKKRTPDETAKEVRRARVQRLGFNPDHQTVRTHAELRKCVQPVKLAATSGLILDQRILKDAGEVEATRRAIRVAEEAFTELLAWIRPGVTEREIAARLEYEMANRGASGPSFPTIVACGSNSSLPHYEPGDRRTEPGVPILIDWGARVDWYCSDLTRMVWVGTVPPRFREIYGIALEAHDRAIAAIRPGLRAKEIDKVARDHITKAGYGAQFNHSLGHGLGLDIHEAPWVRKIGEEVLKPGMLFTVEPGIYLPGEGGVRVEDDVLVTEDGYEVLTSLPADAPA